MIGLHENRTLFHRVIGRGMPAAFNPIGQIGAEGDAVFSAHQIKHILPEEVGDGPMLALFDPKALVSDKHGSAVIWSEELIPEVLSNAMPVDQVAKVVALPAGARSGVDFALPTGA